MAVGILGGLGCSTGGLDLINRRRLPTRLRFIVVEAGKASLTVGIV